MDDVEAGSLLGVEKNKENPKEQVGLEQAQYPGTTQNDKLGHDLEHNQSAKKSECHVSSLYNHSSTSMER